MKINSGFARAWGEEQEKIMAAHKDEMESLIIDSYNSNKPGGSQGIKNFMKSMPGQHRALYPVWKKLEKNLRAAGRIPHIEVPVD